MAKLPNTSAISIEKLNMSRPLCIQVELPPAKSSGAAAKDPSLKSCP
jgi:hypothetical protein